MSQPRAQSQNRGVWNALLGRGSDAMKLPTDRVSDRMKTNGYAAHRSCIR